MKKIIALLLLLALFAALLTACAKSDPTGLWTAEIRFADYAAGLESLSPGLGEKLDLTGLKLALKLDLSADGSFNLYTEQADLDRLLAGLRETVRGGARPPPAGPPIAPRWGRRSPAWGGGPPPGPAPADPPAADPDPPAPCRG